MALVWNWKDKCGEMCVVQSHPDEEDQMFTVDLYQGNAYLIMIHEFKEADKDKYSVFSFFVDKAHMRTCLGLDKKGKQSGNCFCTPYQRVTMLRLNKAKYKYSKEVVAAFSEAFSDIVIELFSEKRVDERVKDDASIE